MAEEEWKQRDLKYYQNQPYDLEVDINHDDDEGTDNNKLANKWMSSDDNDADQNYQGVVASAPQVKELPKFDISKFEDLPASAEAKELLSIMKR